MLEPLQIAAIVVATLSIYTFRADFASYSIFTVGVFKRLDRAVVEGAGEECAEFYCEQTTDVSERRRYYKEIVVVGMPLLRYDKGESHYCRDHVSFEVLDELDNPKRSTTERLGTSLLAAFVGFLEWLGEPDVNPEQSEFDNVATSAGNVLSLAPVVVFVLLAATVMHLLDRS